MYPTTRQNREAEAANGFNAEEARQTSEMVAAALSRGCRCSVQLGNSAKGQGLTAVPERKESITAGIQGDGGRLQRNANSEWAKAETSRREAERDAVMRGQEARRRELRGVHAPLPNKRYGMGEKAIVAKAEAEITAETIH